MDNANLNDDPLFTKAEAARRLRSGERTIERWISQRRLTYLRVGGRVFISESAIQDFLARATQPAVVGRKRAA